MTEAAVQYENQPSETYAVVPLGMTEADIKKLIKEKADKKLISGNKKSYTEVKSALMDFVHARNRIDERRKEINRETNNKAKTLLSLLEPHEKALRDQVEKEDARIKAIEEEKARREQERRDRITQRINEIKKWGRLTITMDSAEIQKRMNVIQELKKDFDFMEYTEDVEALTDDLMGEMSIALANAQEFEKKQAEQKAEEERLRKEREEIEKQKEAIEEKGRKDALREAQEQNAEHQAPETLHTQNEDPAQAQGAGEEKGNDSPPLEKSRQEDKEKIISWAKLVVCNFTGPATLTNDAYKIVTDALSNIHKVGRDVIKRAESL